MGREVTGKMVTGFGGPPIAEEITVLISGFRASWPRESTDVILGEAVYLETSDGGRIELSVHGLDPARGLVLAHVMPGDR
jgi:hypothetical protein